MSRRTQIRTRAERRWPVNPASHGGLGIRRMDPELWRPCSPRPPGDTAEGNRLGLGAGGGWSWLHQADGRCRERSGGGGMPEFLEQTHKAQRREGGEGRGAQETELQGQHPERWVLSAAPSVLRDRKGVFTACERAEFLFCRAFAAILGETCGLLAVKRITKALLTAAPCKVPP